MQRISFILMFAIAMLGCGASHGGSGSSDSASTLSQEVSTHPDFNADTAFRYVKGQTDFGARVPGTAAHAACKIWLEDQLRKNGAQVSTQEFRATTFDGKSHTGYNIIGQYNADASDRLLLLAHWDSRPWADKDPDAANHDKPVMGANDGASGVGVLLEIARLLNENPQDKGVDILFVDLEDWGEYEDDESWALGARHFATNPFKQGYAPSKAILLDMVGGKDAVFAKEYFSTRYAPQLVTALWNEASQAGYADRFINQMGGAITDDHIELIRVGIPAIDIIEYREEGFSPTWHTASDTIDNIDPATLKAVGQTVINYIY